MRIALINNGIVQNIIEAEMDFAETLGCQLTIEATDVAYIGGSYVNNQFVPAAVAPPEQIPPPSPIMTKLAFLRRLTQAERLAIRVAKTTDPIIEDADSLMQLADDISIADPDTINYLGYLAYKGLLTQARVTEILTP